MNHKYGIYEISSHIDDVWDKTIEFWKKNNGILKYEQSSENFNWRELNIKHKASMKMYGFSTGETYTYYFGHNFNDKSTKVIVDAAFSMFGKGFVWKFPQEYMNKWAQYLEIQPQKLSNKKTPLVEDALKVIQHYSSNDKNEVKFCPYCGFENNAEGKLCPSCDSKLD